ncbi:hypothetical protein D3C79_547030 [compost metagenome]
MHHGAFALAGERQPIGQPEDSQRHQALSGRRQIENFAFLMLQPQRRAAARSVIRQILRGERHAQQGHILCHAVRQWAAIEAVQPVFGQRDQGICQLRLAETLAGVGDFPVRQVSAGKMFQLRQFMIFAAGGGFLRGGDRNAVRSIANGIGQQARQR